MYQVVWDPYWWPNSAPLHQETGSTDLCHRHTWILLNSGQLARNHWCKYRKEGAQDVSIVSHVHRYLFFWSDKSHSTELFSLEQVDSDQASSCCWIPYCTSFRQRISCSIVSEAFFEISENLTYKFAKAHPVVRVTCSFRHIGNSRMELPISRLAILK